MRVAGRPGDDIKVAEDVRTPLYRLDVSRVISKYLGETEKYLSRIFEEASATHATLLLDEADVLFPAA